MLGLGDVFGWEVVVGITRPVLGCCDGWLWWVLWLLVVVVVMVVVFVVWLWWWFVVWWLWWLQLWLVLQDPALRSCDAWLWWLWL